MSQRLVATVGITRARELSYTARTFTGAEAAAWGLVTRAVPADELDRAVAELIAELRENSLGSLAAYKDLYRTALDVGLARGLEYEASTDYAISDTERQDRGVPLIVGGTSCAPSRPSSHRIDRQRQRATVPAGSRRDIRMDAADDICSVDEQQALLGRTHQIHLSVLPGLGQMTHDQINGDRLGISRQALHEGSMYDVRERRLRADHSRPVKSGSEGRTDRTTTVGDAIFNDPRLVRVYDAIEGDRRDLETYLDVVDELGVRSVLDIGCGTGTFACRWRLGVSTSSPSIRHRPAWSSPAASQVPARCAGCTAMRRRCRRSRWTPRS